VTGRTRYAQLMADAAGQVGDAALTLGAAPLGDRRDALAAVASYRDLLAALHRHGWELLGAARHLASATASTGADPRDVAAVRFVDSLAIRARRRRFGEPVPDAAPSSTWAAAAAAVRAATDLLATHRDPAGGWRTPEAELLDQPSVRAVGLAGLADLATTVAAADRQLSLRCRQAGLGWRELARRVPDLFPVRCAAQELGLACVPEVRFAGVFDGLEVARPDVRAGDPVVELGDRILRLRRVAWLLTREPHVGAASLIDFAAAGVIFHSSVAARLGSKAPELDGDPPAWSMLRRAHDARDGWSLVHVQVRQLRTATLGLGVVRADLLGVRDLLCRLAPAGTSGAETTDHAERRLQAVLHGGIDAFTDIAAWNATVVDNLAARGQLHVPGRNLTGDQINDQPRLIAAKLHNRLTAAPEECVRRLAAAYRSVGGPSNRARSASRREAATPVPSAASETRCWFQ